MHSGDDPMNRPRRSETGGFRLLIRSYFSTYLLWRAEHEAEQAMHFEASWPDDGKSDFDSGHRGHVLAAILGSIAFVEATANELFQDAYDGHGVTGDGYLANVDDQTRIGGRVVARHERWHPSSIAREVPADAGSGQAADDGSRRSALPEAQLVIEV